MQVDDLAWFCAEREDGSLQYPVRAVALVFGLMLHRKGDLYAFSKTSHKHKLLEKFDVTNVWMDEFAMNVVLSEMEKHPDLHSGATWDVQSTIV